uniref:Capsule gland specific secretory protein n=2 Tax=Reishia TaxID=55522 RepID=A0A6G9KQN2_9CAEN|nr:capsule gland specific secretory protein [Reishia bronni]
MLIITALAWATLGLALDSVYAADCESLYHGECHSIYSGCPQGFNYYTYSGCSFLSQCCYNLDTSSSGHVTHTTTRSPSGQAACGTRDYTENHRIVGGRLADRRAWPWQVSVRYQGYHMCGGTLIDNQHVLTAQHCFEGTHDQYWTVALGVTDISYVGRSHVYSIAEIVHSRRFSKVTHTEDIAIIKLSKPVDLSGPYARAACLPDKREKFEGQVCTVTGWGNIAGGVRGDDQLRQVDIPIIPVRQCQYYLNSIGGGRVTEKQVCAGLSQGGKDACQGDSGGPLVCFDDVKQAWKIVGIVSWGYGCALRNLPGVYTSVSEYIDWIENARSGNGMIG